TPGVVTIEALRKAPYSVPSNRQIKTLVYIADSKPVIVLIRGDDQLNETKFAAKTGSLGAVVNVPAEVKVFADERLQGANDMTTGANEDGFHLKNVSIERDIKVTSWFDLRTVTAGEPRVKCGKALQNRRAIEVGHG